MQSQPYPRYYYLKPEKVSSQAAVSNAYYVESDASTYIKMQLIVIKQKEMNLGKIKQTKDCIYGNNSLSDLHF